MRPQVCHQMLLPSDRCGRPVFPHRVSLEAGKQHVVALCDVLEWRPALPHMMRSYRSQGVFIDSYSSTWTWSCAPWLPCPGPGTSDRPMPAHGHTDHSSRVNAPWRPMEAVSLCRPQFSAISVRRGGSCSSCRRFEAFSLKINMYFC